MRVISQNGTIDVPYERFIISVNMQEQSEIIAWTGNHISDDECIVMASYSSEENAEKAMEMLRNFRTITTVENIPLQKAMLENPFFGIFYKCFDWSYWSDDKAGILKVDVVKKCDYFQFPQDEDVEV